MKLDTDKVVAWSAVVIGLCSLFIVVYQTMLSREAARASVMPYLMIALQVNNDDTAFMLLSNTGIGPALIDDVKVLYQGQEIPGDAYDFATANLKLPGVTLDVDKIAPGRLIPAGFSTRMVGEGGVPGISGEMMRLFNIAEVPDSWYVDSGLDPDEERAVLVIDYSSVYGERWRIRSDNYAPEAL